MISKLATDIIGYVGGSMLAIHNVPLLVKIWKTRSTQDLSYTALCIFIIGSILTIIYGILIQAPPVYGTIVFSLGTNIVVLVMKLFFEHILLP
jgi:MtN3 and saliva related transmembrane protein